ncbi:MAG: DUF1566 domain-containing protein, partial [Acidobacteria bacterium]|nr:DUF1566 domain-containing protein [Acidobacteriota bacterium]
ADTVTVTQTSGSITASGSVEFVDGAAVTTPVTVGAGSGGGSSSTSSSTTTVPAFVPTVGATGPGGGTIIAVFETPFACGPTLAATCTYLEMAAANWQQHPSIGSSETGDPARSWSGDTGTSVGETNNDLGHGYRNTETIVLADGTANRAGTLARAYNGGGLTDWFLPSGDELNELCKYALQQTTGDVAVSCVASGSLRSGFTAASYWSSAETSATLAWTRSLTNGAPSNVTTKAETHRIRPVRAG